MRVVVPFDSVLLQTFLQVRVHAAREPAAFADLFAQRAVVLDEPHHVPPVAVGPEPVAWHQAGRRRGARGAALLRADPAVLGAAVV